jgi:hypothetical protein
LNVFVVFVLQVIDVALSCTYLHLFLACFSQRGVSGVSACKITHVFLELSQYHLYFSTVILHVDMRRRDILMIWFGFVALLFISEYCMYECVYWTF